MFVKICGMTRLEDALAATAQGANAVGFIAHPPSPRFISPRDAAAICEQLPAEVCKVGVFVDASLETIQDYVEGGINAIQLHGQETAQFAETLRREFNVEIWKVLKTRAREDIDRVIDFPADRVLIDTFSKTLAGGTGKVADWNLAAEAVDMLSQPVILAGGLNAENIASAIQEVKPSGLDISSGVEKAPGIKDHQKITDLFREINRVSAK